WFRGGIFDRIELIQGIETIRFWRRHHLRIGRIVAPDAPDLREIGAFVIPEGAEFDPAAPWELQLLAQRSVGKFDQAFVTFSLPYRLPELYTKPAPQPSPAATAAPAGPASAGQATGGAATSGTATSGAATG